MRATRARIGTPPRRETLWRHSISQLSLGQINGNGKSRISYRVALPRMFQKRNAIVEIIQRYKYAVLFSPFTNPSIAAVLPRYDLNSPSALLHSRQIGVKSYAIQKACAVAGQHDDCAWISIVVETIPQHFCLQYLVYSLFATVQGTSFQQPHLHTAVFQPIPNTSQFRRDGTSGNCPSDSSPRVRQLQYIREMNPYSRPGRFAFPLNGNVLSTKKDVGIIPIDENIIHRPLPPYLANP